MTRPESLAELLAWKAPYVKHLIGNGLLVPQGKAILFGPYKSWKSMSAIDLSFSLASGVPWLGFSTTACSVLVIQLEIPKYEYQQRILKYSLGNKLNPTTIYFENIRNLKLDKGWGIAQLESWIQETGAQVVVIDPIYKVVSGRLTDEYDIRQFTDRMDEIIDKHKVSMVLIHHEGKDMIIEGEKYDRGADASFGSAVFGWWCDTSIELRAEYVGSNRVEYRFPLLRLSPNDIKPFKVSINRDNLVFEKHLEQYGTI